MWVLRRPNPPLHLFFVSRDTLPETHLRPADGPDQYSYASAAGGIQEAARNASGGILCGGEDSASNADMRPAQIRKYCALDDACQKLMKTAMRQLQLTARAYHRVLKLSRTIAGRVGGDPLRYI